MSNEPKWSGKFAEIDDNADLLMPVGILGPVVITIWDCNDAFLLVFTDELILTKAVDYIVPKMGLPLIPTPDIPKGYIIQRIKPNERQEFLEGMSKNKVRVMVDADFVSDEHTRWHEILPKKEAAKFAADHN